MFIFLTFAINCFAQSTPVPILPEKPPSPDNKPLKRIMHKITVREGLEDYFIGTEIRPRVIVNNIDAEEFRYGGEIAVGDYRIKWTGSYKEETKIDIAGDVFPLNGKLSLNHLETDPNDEMREVDFANMWDQVKLYEFGDRKLMGISMSNFPCTGIGCGVSFFLIYDLKTKNKTFFGGYRIPGELKLFDFGNDGTVDYLCGIYSGDPHGVAREISNIYELYTMDENGNFQLRHDKNGKKYFIKRTFNAKTSDEIDRKFETNWLEEIRFYRVILK